MAGFQHKHCVPFVEQMQQTECGLCCVAMIMKYYKSNEKITTIRNTLEAGRDGLKLSHLSDYLKERGFSTKIYKAHYSYLKELPLPAIIFWNKEHFVVLEKYHNNHIIIVDSAFGRRKISEETLTECYSGVVMTVIPTEDYKPVREKNNVWSDVISYILKKKLLMVKIIILSLFTYGLQMGIPLLIQNMLDALDEQKKGINNNQYLLLAFAIISVLGVMNFLRTKKVLNLQLDADGYLSKGTFSKLLKLPYKYFEGRASGDILFRLNSLATIRNLLSEQVIQTIMQAGMIIFIISYMMLKSKVMTVLSILVLFLLGVFILAMKPLIAEVNYDDMMENTKLQTVQVETIYSMFAIKVAAIEKNVEKNWLEAYDRSLKTYERKNRILNIYTSVVTLIQTLMPVLLLGMGLFFSINGDITVGETIAVYSLSGSLFAAGISIYNSYNDFISATGYMERIHDIIDTENESNPEDPIEIAISGDVEIRNLSFSYTKYSGNVLEDINLKIEKGEKVAIVGTSGSGKSTLAKIILGLYEPSNGDILYDGVSIQNLNKTRLRKQIGVVPQDMSLFNKTIFENIRMNQEDLGQQDVERAAEVAQISSEIESMPMKYHTIVSDMGMNLSGGQRQRIALARAVIHNHNLIVLDEATSALDNENERKIFEYLAENACTRIMIAHRLSTVIDADKIVVLEKGRICEIGSHNELIQKNGVYAHLYHAGMQMAG